jgi:streptomycin 6-kinase
MASFLSLSLLVDQWWAELPNITARADYDSGLVARAVARGRELAATQSRQVLLHGDFHPGNVLAATREPWLIIDPKPLVGEPAYDLAQWLSNRWDAALATADPVQAFRQQIDRFAASLGLDPARIAGWAFVKALGWEWGPDVFSLFHDVARAW